LELVLVTPLPPRMMVRGQWQALRAQFKGPLLIALFVNAALLWLVAVHDPLGMSENAREDFCGIFCGGAALLLVDVYALSWVGMWLGARGKRHHRAVLATLGQVMVPSWLAILALVMSVYMANGISMEAFKVLVALWFLSSAVFSLRAAVTARRQLLHEFRRLATEPKIGAGPEPEEEGTPDLVGEPAVTRSFT
jgi:hypothetical protein